MFKKKKGLCIVFQKTNNKMSYNKAYLAKIGCICTCGLSVATVPPVPSFCLIFLFQMCLKIAGERELKPYPFLGRIIENKCNNTEWSCIDSPGG